MSLIFWSLLLITVALGGAIIYSMTRAARDYREQMNTRQLTQRQQVTYHDDGRYSFDWDFFYGRWFGIFAIITVIWTILEVGFKIIA